ncbi:MAG TPA: hypothetical protein VGC66_23220 [Pyrinomonadaceae bacterium]|jgi:hypothetical protein
MGKDFDALSSEQQNAFQAEMKRMGIDPTALNHEGPLVTGATPGPTILSADPAVSHVPPTLIQVNSIAHLNELRGTPDEDYTVRGFSDKSINYPPELPAEKSNLVSSAEDLCALRDQLTPEEHANIRRAAEAYVMGNSEKVKSYEPIINATMFPQQMAVFAGESIVVSAANPLIIKGPGPVTLNYASITVEDGGEIIIQTAANITTQTFTQQ